MRGRISALILLCVTAWLLPSAGTHSQAAAAEKFVTIGTAGVTGVYYPAGGAICRLVKRGRKEHGIRCFVEPTDGSIYNLQALRSGDLDMAVVQSDWQYHAVKGTSVFAKATPDKHLRSLFSLHAEPFTVAVHPNSGIKTFDDLKGKRVSIGNIGSGMRAMMEELMLRKGWTHADFSQVFELKAQEQSGAMCKGKIDAMVFAAGHPNAAIQEVTSDCGAKLISVEGAAIDALIKESPYYAYTVIPAGMYPNNNEDIKTFGTMATFVTTDKLDDEVAYEVVRAVFSNLNDFRTLHPVFSLLSPNAMMSHGNTAPLHPGAKRYYEEATMARRENSGVSAAINP